MLSAEKYHRNTSYDRYNMKGHGLDWDNQPRLFKIYPELPTVPLVETQDLAGPFFSELILGNAQMESVVDMDLEWLSKTIWLTHAVTAKARHGTADFYYRNVASAGALYPFELYVGVKGVKGVEAGLYHHSLGLNALTRLRSGDMGPFVSKWLRNDRESASFVVFIFSAIYFRSAWKYRDRAYRYHLLDTGHMVENLALAMAVQKAPFQLVYDFDDEKMNRLLGVDSQKEGCLAIGFVQGREKAIVEETKPLGPLPPGSEKASRVSSLESDLALIREIHKASSVVSDPTLSDDVDLPAQKDLGRQQECIRLKGGPWPETMHYSQAVLKRRSKRNFVRRELTAEELGGLVELLCFGSVSGENDVCWTARQALSVGLLCGRVAGGDPGFYLLDPAGKELSLAVDGFILDQMAQVCLDQAWLANSAAHVVFLSDLEQLEKRWGPRGYRYTMMTAGRLGQRIYLGTTAMGLGCCGIGAFYDDEAGQLLRTGKRTRLLYLVAIGPVKR